MKFFYFFLKKYKYKKKDRYKMNGTFKDDVGENPFSRDGYNAEEVSMIILGVCGGIATIIYAFKRLTECSASCGKICCVESECKQEQEK